MTKTISFPVINLKSTGSNIESCRREAGLSVRDLQDYFGFEYPQAIYKWQHGECLPTVDNLLALSRILEVKMEDLLVYEDQEVSFLETGDGSSGDRGRFSVSFYWGCRNKRRIKSCAGAASPFKISNQTSVPETFPDSMLYYNSMKF